MQRNETMQGLQEIIAEHCRRCSGLRNGARVRCSISDCPLAPDKVLEAIRTAELKLIGDKCMYCMGGQKKLIGSCTQTYCLLWPYRNGG